MENKIIFKWLGCNEETDEFVIIKYELQQLKWLVLNITTFLAISEILFGAEYGIIFLVSFVPIRRMAGGYHADTRWNCYLVSNIIYIINLILIKKSVLNMTNMIVCSIITGFLIVFLAPIDNKNNRLKRNEKKVIKQKCIKAVVVGEIVMIIAYLMRINIIFQTIFWDLITVLALQLVGIIKNFSDINDIKAI